MIVSYRIEKEVIRDMLNDTCYGICRIVRGDGIVCKTLRGQDRPMYLASSAMEDAIKLSLHPSIDEFFDSIYK